MTSLLAFSSPDTSTTLTISTSQQCTTTSAAGYIILDEASEETADIVLHPMYFDSFEAGKILSNEYTSNSGILPLKGTAEFNALRVFFRGNEAIVEKTSRLGARDTTWRALPKTGLTFSIKLKKGSLQPVVTMRINADAIEESIGALLASGLQSECLTWPVLPIALIVKSTISTSTGKKDLSVTLRLSPANLHTIVRIGSQLVEIAKIDQQEGKSKWSWEHRGKVWTEESVVHLFRSKPSFELTSPAKSVPTALLCVLEGNTRAKGNGSESGKEMLGEGKKIGLSKWLSVWEVCTLQ